MERAVPGDAAARRVERALTGGDRWHHEAVVTIERTWLDTFDWRLDEAGARLEYEAGSDGTRRLTWWDGDDRRVAGPVRQPVAGAPRFPTDIGPGVLRDRIDRLVGIRALLPRVTVEVQARRHRLVDAEGKTRVRVACERVHLVGSLDRAVGDGGGGSGAADLGSWMRIEALRGYEDDAARVVGELDRLLLEVAPAATGDGRDRPARSTPPADLATRALAALDRRPGDYSSKLRIELAPDRPAFEAWRSLLAELRGAVVANEPGVRGAFDTEFLHDLRVAVRRARTVVGAAGGVLGDEDRDALRPELRWVQQVTGPARDLDVHLLGFDDLVAARAAVDGDAGEDPAVLEPLRRHLERRRAEAHAALVDALDSDRFRRLVDTWGVVATGPRPLPRRLPDAGKPVAVVAAARIARAHARVRTLGRTITDASPASDLHELRKRGKRLRYLVECFRSLTEPAHVKPPLGLLKSLQDNLGEFQDCEVQAASLRAFASELGRDPAVPPETLVTIGVLTERLRVRQGEVRDEFASRFSAFDRKKVRKAFAHLTDLDDASRRAARGGD